MNNHQLRVIHEKGRMRATTIRLGLHLRELKKVPTLRADRNGLDRSNRPFRWYLHLPSFCRLLYLLFWTVLSLQVHHQTIG